MPQLWRFKGLPYALAYFRWLPWPPTSGNGRWHHGRSEQREGEITWQNRNPDHGRGWVHCTIALSSELTGGLTITTPISSRAATQHLAFPHFSSTLLGALLPSHGHTETGAWTREPSGVRLKLSHGIRCRYWLCLETGLEHLLSFLPTHICGKRCFTNFTSSFPVVTSTFLFLGLLYCSTLQLYVLHLQIQTAHQNEGKLTRGSSVENMYSFPC